MPVDPIEFKSALAQFGSGVTVVTTRDGEGRPVGLTVSAFCSVSLEPPLVLVCIDHRSDANNGMRASGVFGISVLSESQEEISRRFALGGPEKFERVLLEHAPEGVTLVPGALAQLICRVVAGYQAGDHTIWVGEVERQRVQEGRPLLYQRGSYRRLAADEEPS